MKVHGVGGVQPPHLRIHKIISNSCSKCLFYKYPVNKNTRPIHQKPPRI